MTQNTESFLHREKLKSLVLGIVACERLKVIIIIILALATNSLKEIEE